MEQGSDTLSEGCDCLEGRENRKQTIAAPGVFSMGLILLRNFVYGATAFGPSRFLFFINIPFPILEYALPCSPGFASSLWIFALRSIASRA